MNPVIRDPRDQNGLMEIAVGSHELVQFGPLSPSSRRTGSVMGVPMAVTQAIALYDVARVGSGCHNGSARWWLLWV